jgi:hypothetical protein
MTFLISTLLVYGSNECEFEALRLHKDGLMNFTNLGYNKEALPQGPQERLCQ